MDYKHQSQPKAGALSLYQAGLIVAYSLTGILYFQYSSPVFAETQIAQQYPKQPQQKRRTLFDILFGNSRQQKEIIKPPVRKPMRQPVRANSSTGKKKPVISKRKSVFTAPVQSTQPEALAKNPDAKKVLVIGDFMAGGLAEGLDETFAQVPELQIINRANGSSGFVKQDYYNWSKELPAILSKQKPDIIVMMIGSNDHQALTEKKITVAPDTQEWKQIYRSRVDAFLQMTSQSGITVVWIGQPPYQSPTQSQTILSLNAIYKMASEQPLDKPAASFIDVWDGFVDDKGSFTQTGVDVNGQTVRLRANDGINLTSAGKNKLAFYAEKPLRQILKLSTPSGMQASERIDQPIQKAITRIGPLKLSDLNQSGDVTLLGDRVIISRTTPVRRDTEQPHRGRVDDFRWPRQ